MGNLAQASTNGTSKAMARNDTSQIKEDHFLFARVELSTAREALESCRGRGLAKARRAIDAAAKRINLAERASARPHRTWDTAEANHLANRIWMACLALNQIARGCTETEAVSEVLGRTAVDLFDLIDKVES